MNFNEQEWYRVVTLSEAKGLSQHGCDNRIHTHSIDCHPERSEGSLSTWMR